MPGLITRPRARSQRDTIVGAWDFVNQGTGAMAFAVWAAMAIDEHSVHRFADPTTR
jgi:hypothetical protein